MMVIVDTSVWSLVLRRRNPSVNPAIAQELSQLIQDGRVAMLGVIRQELLSGLKEQAHFEKLREYLRAFPDVAVVAQHHEEAAAYFNQCRRKGIQGSNTDFFICAVAVHHGYSIFTTDSDFEHYAQVLPIRLQR